MIDESKIREKAYELWEQAGGAEGSPDTYWHRARELLEAGQESSAVDTDDSETADLESGADKTGSDESSETSSG